MPETNIIKKIKDRSVTFGTMNFEFFSSGIGKILFEAGADFIIYDQEHSSLNYEQIKTLSLISQMHQPLTMVRIPALEYHLISKCLDAGAKGIMVPKIEKKEQAEKLVEYARYRPEGKRGLGFGISHDQYERKSALSNPINAGSKFINKDRLYMLQTENFKKKMGKLNEDILLIALIETELGIKNCEEILSVPGIDIGWIGHYDLTDSMGIVGQFENEKFFAALDKFLSACNKFNKPAGILDNNISYLKKMINKGFTVIGYGHDIAIIQNAYTDGINELKKIKENYTLI